MPGSLADDSGHDNVEKVSGEDESLFVHGPMVIFKWLDVVGWPVQYVSPNIFSHFGYSAADFSASGRTLADLIHPDDLHRVTKEVFSFVRTRAPFFEQEYRLLRADGAYRWVHVHTVTKWKKPGEVAYFLGYLFDITYRKKTEELLDRERSLLRSLVRTIPDLVWLKDPEGVYLLCNPTFEKFFGASEAAIIGKTDYDFVDPELATFFRNKDLEAVAAGGPSINTEWITFACDGHRALLETIKTPMRDSEGRLIGVLGIGRDITDMNEAQETLRHSQRMLTMTMDLAKMAYWSYDKGKNLFTFDDHFYALYGTSADEMGGLQMSPEDYIRKFIPPDEMERIAEVITTNAADDAPCGARELTHRIRRADGQERHIIVRFDIIKDSEGKTIGSYGANQDITEQKKAEDEIRKQSIFLRTLLDTLPIPVFYKDTNRLYTDCNREFEKFFGMSRDEIIGKDVFNVAPQNIAAVYADKDTELFENPGTQVYEWKVRNMKGEEREVIFHKATFVDADGRIAGLLGAISDITELKRMEREHRDLNATLEMRVAEETDKRMANERMLVQQAKMAAMGEMMAAIAHQWRQPLNIVGLCIQNLVDAHAQGNLGKDFFTSAMGRAMEQIRHMSKTIDDFRNFFMPDKSMTVFSLCSTLRDVCQLCEAQLVSNDIRLEIDCLGRDARQELTRDSSAQPSLFIEGFRNEFRHVILNLINNAIDAIKLRKKEGGPRSSGKGVISARCALDNKWARITISDNGTGIPEEIIDRIFEPYFTTKSQSAGTGVGLYMSRMIIEDHMKGRLIAGNSEDGASFTIILPAVVHSGEQGDK
jgi:PAS domain S-box-containing protein